MPNSAVVESLASVVERNCPHDGVHESKWPSMALLRVSRPLEPIHLVQEPALCVIVQGAKRVTLGEESYDYDADRYLVVSVDLPMTGEVIDAGPDRPYLAIALRLDVKAISDLLASGVRTAPAPPRGLGVSPLDSDLRNALERLVNLIEDPGHLPVLGPLIEREILYRLLVGPQGGRLRAMAMDWGSARQVARAVALLRSDYARSLSIEALAREVGMSVSGLHHHFKAVTAMSPLQFQKRVRLQEARRLMAGEGLDAASAAFRVGYESPSQFSREYRRMFGAPPARDVAKIRDGVAMVV